MAGRWFVHSDRSHIQLCAKTFSLAGGRRQFGKETAMIVAPQVMMDLLRDESGQDLIEYGLIIAVMALALIASMNRFTNTVANFFNSVGNTL